MVSTSTLLLTSCCILLCIHINEACQNFRSTDELEIEEVEGAENRRRRGRSKTEKTVMIRDYFTTCMATLLNGATYDWRSCVDFTILDSLWYLNTEQTYCSPGGDGDTLECWQEELTNFLKKGPNRVLETAQTCIAHFAQDKNSIPPRNRYKQRKQFRGRRTTASSGSYIVSQGSSSNNYFSSSYSYSSSMYGYKYLPSYATCLTTLTFDDRRAPLNFRNLSLFIDENTLDGCSMRNRPRRGNGPSWPYRFVSLTRPDSVLRNELELCARRVYPPSPYWTSWGAFGSCSATCGSGRQIKRRSCRSGVNPAELSSGCRGSTRDVRKCNTKPCPQTPKHSWGRWGVFSKCSKSCGGGTQVRRRQCRNNGRSVQVAKCKKINGARLQRKSCNNNKCPEKYSWTSWSPFSRCKKVRRTSSCRKGVKTRSRRCRIGNRQASSGNCNGVDKEHRLCFLKCSSGTSSSSGLASRFSYGFSYNAE